MEATLERASSAAGPFGSVEILVGTRLDYVVV
jgi:hypothetical protein